MIGLVVMILMMMMMMIIIIITMIMIILSFLTSVQLDLMETICRLLFASPRNQAEFRKMRGYNVLATIFTSQNDFDTDAGHSLQVG